MLSDFNSRLTLPNYIEQSKDKKDLLNLASYHISYLIAKFGKSHTDAENLIKPSIIIYLKYVLNASLDDAEHIPLSNDSVSRRIDSMGDDVEKQLIDKIKTKKISIQVDETTIRGGEVLLLTYVRYIEFGAFCEELLFCSLLETTTQANDIYNVFVAYFYKNNIPLENIVYVLPMVHQQ